MTPIIAVVFAFILTGLIGNRLIQVWQQRNWLLQQRFLGHEKEYTALKDLADEIAGLVAARVYRMQRLASILVHRSEAQLDSRVSDYDEVLKRWNDRITSFYVRLRLFSSFEMAQRLEKSIQDRLVSIGTKLETQIERRRSGETISASWVSTIQRDMNVLQGRIIEFNRDLLREVEAKRTEMYYDKEVPYLLDNLEQFSTWQLIKAVFISDVDSFSIVRPTLDFERPVR